jgi:methionine sulfoxide reductase catalytic subunit
MPIRIRRGWELPESAATPESVFHGRRRLLKGLAAGPMLLGAGFAGRARADDEGLAPELYPAERNAAYTVDREMTDEALATTYNNFYEYGSHKQIWRAAQELKLRPWTVTIDGMVANEVTLDAEDLIRRMPIEERVYRLRCVEAWAMTVPWIGFPMAELVRFAEPTSGARYVEMQTFLEPEMAPGQRQFWYPWPYIEGLTLEEATNELAFIGTGLYGKTMPKQNGAPIRLVAPWKYGFKSLKSIVRFTFTDQRPKTFWETVQGQEYGFWANVNPEVAHPRWSQATEELIGSGEKVPTRIYNGYGEYVAHLYDGIEGERLFM